MGTVLLVALAVFGVFVIYRGVKKKGFTKFVEDTKAEVKETLDDIDAKINP